MNCKECQGELENFIQRKLSDEVRIELETHLMQCEDCAEIYRVTAFADHLISQERSVAPSMDLTDRIMDRIVHLEKSRGKEPSPVIRILRPALMAASVAAAIFTGVLIGNIYRPAGINNSRPVELSLIDDAAIESVNLLSND